jgi:multiple sugar transport system permease protein
MSTAEVIGVAGSLPRALPGASLAASKPRRRLWRGGLQGSEYTWAVAFVVPYAAVFFAFVAYPVAYGLWLGRDPALYAELLSEPIYQRSVVNTILYVTIGVNLKMFGALLLSGFFMRRGWWVKGLLLIFVLPWAMPALPAFISFHWMLNGQWGLINNVIWAVFGVDGPGWIETSRWLALGSVIVSHIWKWMPFWTVILLAGRMAIPQELYEAAAVDGATGLRRFTHVTFPLLANLYLICTLLSTIFTLGDFNSVYFVSGGGPALSTHVLATLGIRDAFEIARPDLGVAAVMTALPLMIPLVIVLMRKLRTTEVQL